MKGNVYSLMTPNRLPPQEPHLTRNRPIIHIPLLHIRMARSEMGRDEAEIGVMVFKTNADGTFIA
jgi:hypothetical protein